VIDLAPAFPNVARIFFTSDLTHADLANIASAIKADPVLVDLALTEDDYLKYGKPDDDFR
jgi:hypothetical protein